MVYLISFRLSPPQGQNLAALVQSVNTSDALKVVELIKAVGDWARLDPTTWLVSAAGTSAAQIRDRIWHAAMKPGDTLFVMRVYQEWGAYNLDANVANWLKERQF